MFNRVQDNIAGRWRQKRGPSGSHKGLSGMVECMSCGQPLYLTEERRKVSTGTATYLYYRCGSASYRAAVKGNKCPVGSKSFRADELHQRIDCVLEEEFGGHYLYEEVFVPGVGSHDELERTERAISDLMADRQNGKFTGDRFLHDLFTEQILALSVRRTELLNAGVTESRWERVKTDRTLWDEWTNSDWPKRRRLIHMAGILVRAWPGEGLVEAVEDPNIAARLAGYIATGELPELPPRGKRRGKPKLIEVVTAMIAEHSDPQGAASA